jgi:hypothetical protein
MIRWHPENFSPKNLAAFFLIVCAYFSAAAWTLAAAHQLNFAAYVLATGLLLFALLVLPVCPPSFSKRRTFAVKKNLRRFRRPLPAMFLLTALLALLGGLLHAPNNYDALTYRLPRVLNWMDAGRWFWIDTNVDRMNYSCAGWEWLAMPLLLLFKSDRLFFLINFAGFILLPGLLFSIFKQVGIRRRVAWAWMWILPLAYGFIAQAASVGNDMLGAVFCLMSVHFGLRARKSGRAADIWLCGLAAALTTGEKLSNLPLLLPCLVAVWPALKVLRRNLISTVGVAVVCLLVSCAPTVILNQAFTGDWTGDPHNVDQMKIKNPAAAFLGNSLLLFQQSLMPPVLPRARELSDWFDAHLPAAWRRTIDKDFPRYHLTSLNELPQEEESGLGLGITLLVVVSLAAAIKSLARARPKIKSRKIISVGVAAWCAAIVFMFKMGSEADPRLLLPYYLLLLIPLLQTSGQSRLVRSRLWQSLAVLTSAGVIPFLLLSPSRPLIPPEKILPWLQGKSNAGHVAAVYSGYAQRNDALAPIRDGLPPEVRTVGLIASGNDAEYSLWRPFGRRRVIDLWVGSKQPEKLPENLQWLVIKERTWRETMDVPLPDWLEKNHATVVRTARVVMLVNWGPENWLLVRLK